ncbi:DUF2779 domain-containing protein [Spiroplasma cantharicola]|uniref:DUF2779 domain-containing protein n=1 Tax=Spiroplasma cantharicola TaxID=362837 RepID=A0A0M3SJ68_9MOLU|nr:DUF2779 domain-containing protein [Spiroplasma cantharicola]ALD66228.1 hypothetical protein SCANT_v1c03180 [Spiroplasma cantharicola]
MKVVTKEDFKRYMSVCPKIAWIFHSLENFKKIVNLRKNKIVETHYKVEMNSDEDFNSSFGFNAIDLYSDLLTQEESLLTKEQLIQKDLLIKQLNDLNGFEISGLPAETIVDGLAVGEAAREYYIEKLYEDNAKNKTNFEYFDFQDMEYHQTIKKTKELLENRNIKYLFEPTFEANDSMLRVRCDVLINHGNRHVTIVEFKASTASKVEHFFDVMYQKKVLEKNGYIVDDVNIGLINRDYIRATGIQNERRDFEVSNLYNIDFENDVKPKIMDIKLPISGESDLVYSQLIRITDKLDNSTKLPKINSLIDGMEANDFYFDGCINEILNFFESEKNLFNSKCQKIKFEYAKLSYKIEEKYCQHVVPYYDKTNFNLYELSGFKASAAIIHRLFPNDIYIENIKSLEDSKYIYNSKNLFKDDQKRVIKVVSNFIKNKKLEAKDIIKEGSYETILNDLKQYYKYPVYMYDFETVKWAIPKYDNSWSYQQIPFQYSIHVIDNPNYDFNDPINTMKHLNFIASKQEDPRPEFLLNFIRDCFKYGPGVYVAYNKSFEKGVLKNLIYCYPQFTVPLTYIYMNTIDLMEFFRKKCDNWLIYHPEFRGSYSIKKTQPALDSSLNYKDLKINKGDKASQTFRQFLDNIISQEEYEIILKEDMLKYCDRDTLAMIVVLQKVVDIIKEYNPNFLEDLEKQKEDK